jgi:sulfopyruvate decarboxylase TPP-binding subunit
MITKNDLNEKDMIDAINEIEVIYRTNKAILEENEGRLKEDIEDGIDIGRSAVLHDIKVVLDLLEQKKYKKPEIVK